MWTRRSAAVEFTKAKSEEFSEIEKLNQQTKGALEQAQAANKLAQEVNERTKNDSEAISLVKKILESRPREQPVDQKELNEIIKKASKNAKAQIFYEAAEVRSDNRIEDKNKPILELTIPIFRALIASDTEKKYHRNHGELGFALKDKQNVQESDWKEACNELTTAIEIRGEWKPEYGPSSLYYEINRAVCKINLDKEYKSKKLSTPEARTDILKDIEYKYNYLPDFQDKSLSEWLKLNKNYVEDKTYKRFLKNK